MLFRNQGELAGPVRFHNAPGLLLAFVAISVLAHGATLLFSTEPVLSPPTTRFGTTIISTILSPVENNASTFVEKSMPPQKKPEIKSHKNLSSTNKPATPIKNPPTLVSRTVTYELAAKQTPAAITAPEKNQQNFSRSKTVKSPPEKSLSARMTEQRNYLLGELQNRLSKYLTYPLRARRRGWQGEVMVTFYINERGKLGNVRLAHSSGYSLLDRSAVNAIAKLDEITLPNAMGPLQAMELQLPVRYQLRDS